MSPTDNEYEDETSGEEVVIEHNPDWDAAAKVTEPVTTTAPDFTALATANAAMTLNAMLSVPTAPKPTVIDEGNGGVSSDEPTDAEVEAAMALLARRKPKERDPEAPVSDLPLPIRLIEEIQPQIEAQTRFTIGDMEIIGTAEKIEYVKKLYGVTKDPEQAVMIAAQPQNPMITAKITAEQEAGRRALAMRQAQAVSHPRLPKTEHELELEKPPITVFRGTGADIQQHLMKKPAVANKGPGY